MLNTVLLPAGLFGRQPLGLAPLITLKLIQILDIIELCKK